ncbi:LUD domain-containing protein [Streptomyces sp. JJ36]|uniref:LutC/YkgG family protein n=1 Tax=Streptomyces sp. JJ36 TaxID=2736645 RepID=UPI0027958217|nr:LUD domain-containing protein [Streptomyces sp. JJ36]MCF6525505.1 LUD domain-containing protein [Streptomyces sp. JJ36]
MTARDDARGNARGQAPDDARDLARSGAQDHERDGEPGSARDDTPGGARNDPPGSARENARDDAPVGAGAAARRSARAEILARVRAALADVPPEERPEDVPVPRTYARGGGTSGAAADGADVVTLLAERLADYRATVRVVEEAGVPAALAGTLAGRGTRTAVVPEGFPAAWRAAPAGVRTLTDRPRLTTAALDSVDTVVTTAATAVAATGTLVLDGGPGQGRRVLTLVPDHHVCVLSVDRIVATVPEGLARLDPARPLTFVSGPSATSDIELDRVEGVHGPRTLEVLLVRP